MLGPKYKELISQHNKLNMEGTDVGEVITLQRRMNPRKRMYPGEKNIHMKNQIFILGSKVEAQTYDHDEEGHLTPHSRNQQYLSEYHRTVEESAKLMATGEAKKLRPAGVIQDKEFNLSNIE
jgi:hypothetical protein